MTENLGESLRKLRINSKAKLSQEAVAEKIGVSLSTYSRLERDEAEIELSTVIKVADLYKITVDELLNMGNPNFKGVEDSKAIYQKRWTVPITVALDGTAETLENWIAKLTAINAAI